MPIALHLKRQSVVLNAEPVELVRGEGLDGVGRGPTHGFGVDWCDEASVMELINLSQHSKAGFEAANKIIHKMLKKMSDAQTSRLGC